MEQRGSDVGREGRVSVQQFVPTPAPTIGESESVTVARHGRAPIHKSQVREA